MCIFNIFILNKWNKKNPDISKPWPLDSSQMARFLANRLMHHCWLHQKRYDGEATVARRGGGGSLPAVLTKIYRQVAFMTKRHLHIERCFTPCSCQAAVKVLSKQNIKNHFWNCGSALLPNRCLLFLRNSQWTISFNQISYLNILLLEHR